MSKSRICNDKNLSILVEDFFKELRRSQQFMITSPCLEVLTPLVEEISKIDEINFNKIINSVGQQVELINEMQQKLEELVGSLKDVENFSERMMKEFKLR
ncbi:hypothetical protein WA026_008468 [Henosepilachna vigintioctopunctata]|uniref:Uncharacterized protein n=1 Tax=Henosepilachna vigintioctopunctata TaxID=420089 RepID=A0AAW1UFM0_9CUCU